MSICKSKNRPKILLVEPFSTFVRNIRRGSELNSQVIREFENI